MFALTIMTVGTLAVAYTAAVLVDCSMPQFELLWTDPLELCVAFDSLGLGGDPKVGLGLALFSVLAMVAIWVPFLKRQRRRKRIELDRSLAENLSRINPDTERSSSADLADGEVSSETPDEPPEDTPEGPRGVLGKVKALEAQVNSSRGLSRSATAEWMQLLREVNDLHNDGTLPTEEFQLINTRLLDLVVKPPSLASTNSSY